MAAPVKDELRASSVDTFVDLSRVAVAAHRIHSADLAAQVAACVRFAQTGEGDLSATEDALHEALASLCDGPLVRGDFETHLASALSTSEELLPLGRALVACHARIELKRGQGVAKAHLAALAGVGDRSVDRAVQAGDLATDGVVSPGRGNVATVSAKSAKAWLKKRGIQW